MGFVLLLLHYFADLAQSSEGEDDDEEIKITKAKVLECYLKLKFKPGLTIYGNFQKKTAGITENQETVTLGTSLTMWYNLLTENQFS